MITQKNMYVTSTGQAYNTLQEAAGKEFEIQLRKLWPDHTSGFGEIEINILWHNFETIVGIRSEVLRHED